MCAIEQPFRPTARALFADTPALLLAALAAVAAASVALTRLASLPDALPRIAGVAAGHGALLATALAWAGDGPRSGLLAIVLLAGSATAAILHPMGALAYLSLPAWIGWRARGGGLAALGLTGPLPWAAIWIGALAGAFLGGHLLVSASRTLGLRLRLDAPADVLGALAYDLGANVLAAECFFRGALFNRAQRRWSLGAALALSTAAFVARYMVDPLLPKSVEMVVGAAFYLTLLGAANCWLFWWSGSLVPGFAGALLFFGAYRMLGTP
ncbi:MAG: CPBP family glutamic-type intramembrane protease [Candidatus Rokuibacteriota bacterium]